MDIIIVFTLVAELATIIMMIFLLRMIDALDMRLFEIREQIQSVAVSQPQTETVKDLEYYLAQAQNEAKGIVDGKL